MIENLDKIKETIRDFFAKTGISNIEVKSVEIADDESLHVGIFADNASLYIGERGKNIGVFEVVLRLVLQKQLGESPFIHLDINNYRGVKEAALRELAKKAAHRARFYKKDVALEAMSSYDRRIIHTELAAHPDIKTESTGMGEKRRVIVKYMG